MVNGHALALIERSAQEEDARWNSDRLTVETVDMGAQPADLPIIRAAVASFNSLGINAIQYVASSTDCNIPISPGIPAVALRGAERSIRC